MSKPLVAEVTNKVRLPTLEEQMTTVENFIHSTVVPLVQRAATQPVPVALKAARVESGSGQDDQDELDVQGDHDEPGLQDDCCDLDELDLQDGQVDARPGRACQAFQAGQGETPFQEWDQELGGYLGHWDDPVEGPDYGTLMM